MASSSPGDTRSRVASLLADADLCVKCGLCLPHCPTYRERRDEGDSPRGRIALAQGLLWGRLDLGPALVGHLDRCLGCRGCEAVCPARVPYGRLLDGVREELRRRRPAGLIRRLLQRVVADWFVRQPGWLRVGLRLLRAWQGSPFEAPTRRVLAGASTTLARLLRYLPRLAAPSPWAQVYRASGAERGQVALFLGCAARELDRGTLEAALRVLTRLGYTVRVPPEQGCCGAIHLHDGQEAAALAQVRRNLQAFAHTPGIPIVAVASGCAATLAEYATLPGLEPDQRAAAAAFSGRVMEVCDLLARDPWPSEARLHPYSGRVAVHEPCSARNVLRRARPPYEVLGRIPGIELVALTENDQCCGAAGAYMLTQPDMADRLQARKLRAAAASGAATIATVNFGCALHLDAGLCGGPVRPEVLHPVVLIDRQLAEVGAHPPIPTPADSLDTQPP